MDFRIAMGVRRTDQDWKRKLNRLIAENQPEIDKILAEYGVPLLDEQGQAQSAMNIRRRAACGLHRVDWRRRTGAAAEPSGYRMDAYRAPTPATLQGATVLDHGRSARPVGEAAGGVHRCAAASAPPAGSAGLDHLAAQAAARYSRQHLVAGHRLWRPRTRHGGIFRAWPCTGFRRGSCPRSGVLLPGKLLDVVERGETGDRSWLHPCRLVSAMAPTAGRRMAFQPRRVNPCRAPRRRE